ncbi:MAG: hypothetical protein ABIR34_04160, partial [Marmoricola sp.]
MPPTTFAGGRIRVTTPPSYDVQRVRRSRARGLRGDPPVATDVSKNAIVSALKDSGLAVIERVHLTPRMSRDLGRPAGNRAAKVKLEVDLPRGQDAVVLLERNG